MKKIITTLLSVIATFSVLSLIGCDGNTSIRNGVEMATSEQINSSGGYKFSVPDLGDFRITSAISSDKPSYKCSVDVDYLKGALKDLQKGALGVETTISLKAHFDDKTGVFVCSGSGESCKVTINVPDV